MTLPELLASLKLLDEVTLLEILDLHSDEIVDKFQEEIEARYFELKHKVDEPREAEDSIEDLTGVLDWTISHQASPVDEDTDGRSEGDD